MKKVLVKKGQKISHHHTLGVVIFLAGILGTLVVTRVLAQINPNSDIIHVCVNKSSGVMRIVEASDTCRQGEYALSWNIQGQPGSPGPTGVPGLSAINGLPFTCNGCNLAPYASLFRGKDFSSAQIENSEFGGSDLTGIIFKGGYFLIDSFDNSNLTNADFSYIKDVPSENILGSISNLNFHNANLTNANFSNSDFSYSNFTGSNLQNTNFSNTHFINCNFSGTKNTSTANISGATWSNSTCPDGTNSDNNGNTCAGHF